jgi:hypothetical protein
MGYTPWTGKTAHKRLDFGVGHSRQTQNWQFLLYLILGYPIFERTWTNPNEKFLCHPDPFNIRTLFSIPHTSESGCLGLLDVVRGQHGLEKFWTSHVWKLWKLVYQCLSHLVTPQPSSRITSFILSFGSQLFSPLKHTAYPRVWKSPKVAEGWLQLNPWESLWSGNLISVAT